MKTRTGEARATKQPKARARVLVVVKTSSYEAYVARRRDPRTLELLAKKDPSVSRMMASHTAHEATVGEVFESLAELGASATSVTTTTLGDSSPDDFDLVVTIGGDGTLLTTSHGVGVGTPLLGINSAPDHSVGFFCAARGGRSGEVRKALSAAFTERMRRTVVSRMEVAVNDGYLSRRVLNDALFCHEVPAATSRYILTVASRGPASARSRSRPPSQEEEQKSSGLWIGPAAGSTAAQKSAGGRILPLTSRQIQYVVREPYTPTGGHLSLARGVVGEGGTVTLRSKMRQGKLFLDGPHVVHDVGLGDVVTLRLSAEPLTVLGLTRRAASV